VFLQRVFDVEVGGGLVGGFEGFAVAGDLLQGAGECVGVAGEEGAAGVGEVFPLAADGQADELGDEGGEDGRGDSDEEEDQGGSASAAVAPIASVGDPATCSSSSLPTPSTPSVFS